MDGSVLASFLLRRGSSDNNYAALDPQYGCRYSFPFEWLKQKHTLRRGSYISLRKTLYLQPLL